MEKKRYWDQETCLFKELSQGRDLSELLKTKLENSDTPQLCDSIVHNIISIYDKAIFMLNSGNLGGVKATDNAHKKRKTMGKWSKQVGVSSVTGQCEMSDGCSWRKYGQKLILGAKFPRAYYRCTYRHAQGCLATKQVQRSDEDPFLFLISYFGNHSCVSSAKPNQVSDYFETKIPNQYEENRFPNQNQLKAGLDTQEKSETLIFQGNTNTSFLDNLECEISDFGDEYFQISDYCDVTTSCHEIVSAQASTTNSPIGKSDYCYFAFDDVECLSDLPLDTCDYFS